MRLLPLLMCLFLAPSLNAQEAQPFEIEHTIASDAFGEDRKITIYLPPNYYNRPDETYTRNYIPTIVVGVHSKNRGWEFPTPVPGDEDDEAYEGGRAPELQRHLAEEVIPFVEKLYPDARDYKTLMGHSSGGKFVLYSLFIDEPDVFDAYVATSPGLRPEGETLIEDIAGRLAKGATFRKFLYCSAGTVGERWYAGPHPGFSDGST